MTRRRPINPWGRDNTTPMSQLKAQCTRSAKRATVTLPELNFAKKKVFLASELAATMTGKSWMTFHLAMKEVAAGRAEIINDLDTEGA